MLLAAAFATPPLLLALLMTMARVQERLGEPAVAGAAAGTVPTVPTVPTEPLDTAAIAAIAAGRETAAA